MVRALVVADEIDPRLDAAAVARIAPELVLAAGDLPWDYVEFLASASDVPTVFVPGNHDPLIPKVKVTRSGLCLDGDGRPIDGPRPRGAINADDRVVTAAGVRIAGLGGCVRYNDGPHQYTQREYGRRLRRLARRVRRAGGIDVLLTHAPPRGLGDGEDGPHLGIDGLAAFLESTAPAWHLHGHIHPYGEPRPDRRVGTTTIRNVIPSVVLDLPAGDSARAPVGATMVR